MRLYSVIVSLDEVFAEDMAEARQIAEKRLTDGLYALDIHLMAELGKND